MNIEPKLLNCLIDRRDLKEFVENNPKLVTRRQSLRYPELFVLKYTKRVFFDNLWHLNPLLLECRGLVVDKDYNVVVRPFTKVFNYGENDTTIDKDEMVVVPRKVNGFMACATYNPNYSDDIIISTTGSLDSTFVDMAAKWIDPMEEQIKRSTFTQTLMFEICDPDDKHIIEEEYGAYLIGEYVPIVGFTDEKSLDFCADMLGCKRPHWDQMLFGDVLEAVKHVHHEGFMCRGENTTLKIKSPFYLTTKFFTRMNGDKFYKMIENPRQAKKTIDEEYYDLVDYLHEFRDVFVTYNEQEKVSFIRDFLEGEYESESILDQ